MSAFGDQGAVGARWHAIVHAYANGVHPLPCGCLFFFSYIWVLDVCLSSCKKVPYLMRNEQLSDRAVERPTAIAIEHETSPPSNLEPIQVITVDP